MARRILIIHILFFFFSFSANSRTFQESVQSINISGSVIEEDTNEPAGQATVRLLHLSDSTLITGVFTDNEGDFILKDVKPDSYLIEITYLGYQSHFLKVNSSESNVILPPIYIQPEPTMLAEAVVVGHIADVIVKQDTIEYNADAYKVPPGSVAEDLLKRLPGVEVDADGKITVEGKEVKKILVDGKEFFGDDPKVATKNLPTNIINKMQVVDRKSELSRLTGIDDGDDEKIINITIKPGMKNGWFGNVVASGGSKIDGEHRYEGATMINNFRDDRRISLLANFNNTNNQAFSELGGDLVPQINTRGRGRGQGGGGFSGANNGITEAGSIGLNMNNTFSEKLMMDGSVVYGYSNTDAESSSQKQNILQDSISFNNDTTKNYNQSKNLAAEFRFEYKPDSLTQINFRPRFAFNDTFTEEEGYTETLDGSSRMTLVNRSKSYTSLDGNGYNLSGTLDISRQSAVKKGRRITLRLSGDINNGDAEGFNYSETSYFDTATDMLSRADTIDQLQINKNRSHSYRVYASYVEPVFTNRFLQFSYSLRVNNSDSKKNAYSADPLSDPLHPEYSVLDTAYSSNFRNHFVNQQINVSLQTVRDNYDYSFGLEVSPSSSKSERYIGNLVTLSLSRSVVNYAPTARFNYRFTPQRSLTLQYRGQTSQPSMTQLDPTPDISNPLIIRVGNADLKPTFTHRIFLRFNDYNRERQQSLSINGSFNYILNNIANASEYDSVGVQTVKPVNVNGTWNARLQVFYNSPLKNQRFRINSNLTSSFNNIQGFVNDKENVSRTLGISEIAGITYRSPVFDIGTQFTVRYNNTTNSLENQQGQTTWDYGVGGNLSVNLPYNFVLASDINYTDRSGYAAGYTQSEVIWNAELSTRFLKDNKATVKFKVYDILKEKKNIFRTVSASAITDSQYYTLTSYCMLQFIYSFNSFGGSAPSNENQRGGGRREGRFRPDMY